MRLHCRFDRFNVAISKEELLKQVVKPVGIDFAFQLFTGVCGYVEDVMDGDGCSGSESGSGEDIWSEFRTTVEYEKLASGNAGTMDDETIFNGAKLLQDLSIMCKSSPTEVLELLKRMQEKTD